MQSYVTLTIENKVGYVEFFHPDHNALPTDVLEQLNKTLNDAGHNDAIHVIVLKSGGERTFCAGASFKELIAIEDSETGARFFSGFANLINTMRINPKLIIGRVQGKAVGGGVGLAAATDYCLATKYASIKLSELSIGIGPFVIEPAVTRKMGLSAMSQMTINAEVFYSAEYAQEKGLYSNVYETTAALDVAVKTLAETLATYNPEALKQIKATFWENTDHWESLLLNRAKTSGELVLSEFTKNKLKGFR
ncbi:enoyl-CoA hydratase/isomerase family protein [Changchengzhania lutea]|uniref:enoyl-CoA hydratase/isomerase family protein n=1 Tax=Changchengzhania lutea TaxID=2049305 RepID=UPI00115CAC04|nr:enoyl-CoA hydratase/isomerase family protein [Changchengzhania lutea]